MSTALPGAMASLRPRSRTRERNRTGLTMPAPWRRIVICLGLIWLIDAALQYQPYMFGRSFVTGTIEPTASGAPYVVAHPTLWAAGVMLHHITLYNSVFATIQLLIACALLYRPTVEIGLAASIVWSLAVWWFAEGIGGIFDNASPLTGAPGAVLLYALVALLAWPRPGASSGAGSRSVADGGLLGSLWSKVAWAMLWLGLALLAAEGSHRAPSALHDLVSGMQSGQAGWVKVIDRAMAAPLAHHGTEASAVLVGVYLAAGVGVWIPRAARVAVGIAVVVGLLTWTVEDFGGVFTGQATDVNSGLILVLLAACFWPLGAGVPRAGHTISSRPAP